MKSSFSILSLSLLCTALSLSGCSMKRNLDDMHAKTGQMAETTSGMAKTTEGMSQTTNHMSETTDSMRETTCSMYISLRQGNAKVSRDTDFKNIIEGKNIEEKLAMASIYMQGFEFQVWTPDCEDIKLTRESTYAQFARELLAKIQAYEGKKEDPSPLKMSEDSETLYAIAATLHYENSLQKNLLKNSSETVMRPLDILLKGLKIDLDKNKGLLNSDYPEYAEVIGKYQKDAIYLLQLRMNFLLAYAYAVADSDDYGNKPELLKKARRLLGSSSFFGKLFGQYTWVPNLKTRTATEIKERINLPLKLSIETRNALVALGIKPILNESILKIWKSADVSQFPLTSLSQSKKPEEKIYLQALNEFIRIQQSL